METVRAFVAILLSSEAQEVLAAAISQLVDEVAGQATQEVLSKDVNWVVPEKAHLTLRFLGDTPVDTLPAIYSGIDAAAGVVQPFFLHLDRLGCFPNSRRPRVIWVGVAGAVAHAHSLRDNVNTMLEPLGWEMERKPWQPHVTAGRVRRNHRLVRLPWGRRVAPAPVPVQAIHLIESRLRPSGAEYIVRHRSYLGEADGH